MCHRLPDGAERPETLSTAERKHGKIEKETLASVFGVKKFYQYLYGEEFVLLTDDKPLVTKFGSRKGVPVVTAHRLQRWAVVLMGYRFTIEYRRTEEFGQADGLSRLPTKSTELFDLYDLGMNELIDLVVGGTIATLPIDCAVLAKETAQDVELKPLTGYIVYGWPDKVMHRRSLT